MGFFTPGPLELIILMLLAIAMITHVLVVRFVFRINTQIKLLTEIRDLLASGRRL